MKPSLDQVRPAVDRALTQANATHSERMFARQVLEDRKLGGALLAEAPAGAQSSGLIGWIVEFVRALYELVTGLVAGVGNTVASLVPSGKGMANATAAGRGVAAFAEKHKPALRDKLRGARAMSARAALETDGGPSSSSDADGGSDPESGDDAEPAGASGDKPSLRGTLHSHGRARYKHDPEEKWSYYITTIGRNGKQQTRWGLEIESAIAESGAQPGDHIELYHRGKHPVLVNKKVKKDGRVTFEQREVLKNHWEVVLPRLAPSGRIEV